MFYLKSARPASAGRFLAVILLIASFFSVAGCASTPKPVPKSGVRAPARPVDPKVQQHYYDLGLQLYSEENYAEAEEAFQQAVDRGPSTLLGIKAQENIRKIEQILKTLEEMENK
jgi:tetratricopeptide (TPR) repeat protein